MRIHLGFSAKKTVAIQLIKSAFWSGLSIFYKNIKKTVGHKDFRKKIINALEIYPNIKTQFFSVKSCMRVYGFIKLV